MCIRDSLRAEQKSFGKKVSQAQGEEKETLLAEVKTLAQKVKAAENASNEAQATQDELLSRMENLIIDGVPTGGEEDYVTLKTVGEPRDLASEGFEPRDHLEIGELLDGIDMARGATVSGARFYFLKGAVARLEQALLSMALEQATKAGFTMFTTPAPVRPETMAGTG